MTATLAGILFARFMRDFILPEKPRSTAKSSRPQRAGNLQRGRFRAFAHRYQGNRRPRFRRFLQQHGAALDPRWARRQREFQGPPIMPTSPVIAGGGENGLLGAQILGGHSKQVWVYSRGRHHARG